MGHVRSTQIRTLGKDHLVLNTLVLLIRAQQADDARRLLERLSVNARRRVEQSLRGYRFAPNAPARGDDLTPVLAVLKAAEYRYDPLATRQKAMARAMQVLPGAFGGLVALGGLFALGLHGHGHAPVLGLVPALIGASGLGRLYVPQLARVRWPAWTGLNALAFFDAVIEADRLIVPLNDGDDPASSLWVLYSRMVAPIQAARAARKAARAANPGAVSGRRTVAGEDALDTDTASEPSEPPAPRSVPVRTPDLEPVGKLDLQAVRRRMLHALEDAPTHRSPTDTMSIEDRVALLEEHRQRLETRVAREEGVALAGKALVEDFQDVAHESSPDHLTKPGGRSAGAPLVAHGLTKALGTLMQNRSYLVRNGLKQDTVDALTDDYIKALRATYRHLVEDKRYAMSYHMVAQGFSEWNLHVFRTLERCLKNNDPTAADDLIDLERVLSGYNMEHCIRALPLMLLSVQGYALSLEMKARSNPENARYVEMAQDVRRILKNLEEQIPEDVYLKSIELVKASETTAAAAP